MEDPREPIEERILRMVEEAALEFKQTEKLPTQEFADELRELRQQLGMSVEEFSAQYDISTAEIHTAELARGIKPSTKMRLLVSMIKTDPQAVADLVAATKKKNSRPQQS